MRNTHSRWTAAAGLMAAGVLVLSGCSGTATSGGGGGAASDLPESVDLKGQTVASLFTSLNNDYYSSWDQGAKRAVEAFNGEYVAMTNEGDPATQISQFQQQVDAGVKIIFVTAPDPSSVGEMARIANENDVCFANTWESVPWESPFDFGDQYVTYHSNHSYQAAFDTVTALFDEMGGSGNFVHLTGHPGSTPDTQRTLAVDDALKEYPDITLVDRQPGEWNRDDSRNAMAGIISRSGTDIDGVFGQNDDVAIGALNALTEAGIEDVPITGMDGNEGTMELIQSGEIFGAYSSLPQWSAGFSFVQALDACMSGETPAPLNRQLWSGGIFVTADNVQEYLDTYVGDNDPYDWVKMSRVAYPDDWDPQNKVEVLNMEEMWSWEPQPSGYELPEEYSAALPELDATNAEWDEHWKLLRRD